MRDFRHIFLVVGIMISGISLLMTIPALYEYWSGGQSLEEFFISIFISGFTGLLLIMINYRKSQLYINVRDVFIVTVFSWILCCVFAGIPMFLLLPQFSFVDAVFESVSALTTTGFSLIHNFDSVAKSILLWRSILQWIGGIGIIVMAITIFPMLRIGGMQLFHSEFSDRSEKILPRVSQIASAILLTYSGFLLLGFLSLMLCGMGAFDAFCHAASAISTGGFSTKVDGLISFDNTAVEVTISILMIFGGATLLMFVHLWRGNISVLKDQQLRGYLKMIVIFSMILSLIIMYQGNSFLGSLRIGFFSSISIITSTGLVLFDYTKYGAPVVGLIFIMSFIGGCSGSTTGGIKIFRFQVLLAFIKANIKQSLKPHGVFVPLYREQKISANLLESVFSFVSLYMVTVIAVTFFLTLSGLDLLSSLSGAASAVGNVGVGIGDIFGPAGNLKLLTPNAKITLIIAMVIGRLELLTVFVLFLPSFWKK